MPCPPLRSTLRALLSGLMLAACGGIPEEGGVSAEEAAGTRESAICSGSSVSSLTLAGVSSYSGEVAAGGSWSVTYPSNGAHLDYLIDGVKYGEQELLGDSNRSGTWNFSYSPVSCGSHTFKVKAYPITIHSSGVDRCPLSGPREISQSFSESCTVSCTAPDCDDKHGTSCTAGSNGQCSFVVNNVCKYYNCFCNSSNQWICP